MLSRLTASTRREVWVVEAPTLLISLVVAEVFYKFGSFTLEAVALLATWWVLSSIGRWLVRRSTDTAQ